MGIFETFNRERLFLGGMVRTLKQIGKLKPDSPVTVADKAERWARETPDAVALLFEDRTMSWGQLDGLANQHARWAQAQGIAKGDVVAVMMENRPEYIATWLGLVKIGATAALINTNLRGQPFAHSVAIAGAQHLILGAELADNWASGVDLLPEKVTTWTTGGQVQGTQDLDAALAGQSAAPMPPETRAGMVADDKCFYIYTSGTTGLPKAANMSHLRVLNMMGAFAAATNATAKDRMYDVLPLYHSAGGICALGPAFYTGGSVVIRRKFSVSHFWEDAYKYEATLFQYIGELCRYLVNAPEHPLERSHKLRLAIGNGLRPEIWDGFKSRFAMPLILEFYGATEGNIALINFDGRKGAIGRIPGYMRGALPTRIIRFDVEREEPVRGPDGFCIECKPGEVGEAVGKISEEPRSRFEGYTKGADTSKKVLTDVFEKGDRWFRSGDLLKRDEYGYFYFIDRIGDTFRWKGENVATSEVAEVLSVFAGIKEANVYGVKVPGFDGRAGMASVVCEGALDLAAFQGHCERNLPAYARPIFLRIQPEIEITGTFKHRKVDLVREGFDPNTVPDPLHFLHPDEKRYVPLTPELHAAICSGSLKL